MALTLNQIKNKVDAALGPIWTEVQSKQAVWIQTHQNYWQGQRTFTVIPPDGEDATPNWSVKPNGAEDISWAAFGLTLPSTLGGTLGVDNHSGPLGKGYTGWALATFEGRTFFRAAGVGPYSRTQAWVELV